jgi:hypothetical protein
MPQTIRVYYPSGRQMTLPVKQWIGPQSLGRDVVVAVMVDNGREHPVVLLDPRAVIVDDATKEWVYDPRAKALPGEMGEWMRGHPEWGVEIPDA